MPKPAVTLSDLHGDPQNARRHNSRNIEQVQASLQAYGAARSIVIDEDNQIIAGHGVVEAAVRAGIERVQVVDGDGETIIAVRRSGLTRKQKQGLGIADNRASELAEWDADVLAGLKDEIDLGQFWREDELARLMGEKLEIDYDGMWQGMPEFEQQDAFGVKRLIVHFMTDDDVKAFSELVGQLITDNTRYIWYPKQDKKAMKEYRAQDES